jgi:hypothetical protein
MSSRDASRSFGPASSGDGPLPGDTVTSETSYGQTSAAGSGTSYSRADHTHGSPSLTSTAPTTSAAGDAATVGAATAPARADHRHGRESFGSVTAQTSFAASSGSGSATTPARSDHTHGTPTHDAAAHSAIPLSALATPTGDVSIASHKLTNLADGSSAQDAASFTQLQKVAMGGASWPTTGRYAQTPPTGNTNTATMSLNELRAVPFVVAAPYTVDLLIVTVTTGGSTGAVLRAGIYAASATMDPGTLLVDLGTQASTATADVTWAVSPTQTLTPGLWWLACVAQVATCVVRVVATGHPAVCFTAAPPSSFNNCYTMSGQSGALPSTYTVGGTGQGPRFGVRAA